MVKIIDRALRKDYIATLREFEGERNDVPQKISTSFGDALVKLYFCSGINGTESGIAVCKDGTRIFKDITELVQIERQP